VDALRTAAVAHKVVFLRNQPYATEHLVRLTEQLGGHGHTPFLEPMPDHPGVVRVVREANEGGSNFGGAWHSDRSFQTGTDDALAASFTAPQLRARRPPAQLSDPSVSWLTASKFDLAYDFTTAPMRMTPGGTRWTEPHERTTSRLRVQNLRNQPDRGEG